VKLTVAPDAQEPVTVSPEIDTEIRPPRSVVNDVEPPPIEAVALSQICLKFEPVDGGTPVIAAVPKERAATFAAGAGATGEFRLTIGGSALDAGVVSSGAEAVVVTEGVAALAEPSFGPWLAGALATVGLRLDVLKLFVLVVAVKPVDFATIETV
jgi:hypothetical protein